MREQTRALGVLAPDRMRSIVVMSDDGALAAAVTDCVHRSFAAVRDARPGDAAAIAGACLPWPWMLIGVGDRLPRALCATLCRRPVLVLWLGDVPPGLPRHARACPRLRELRDEVDTAITASPGGMRLAPGGGVDPGDGTLLRGAALEALVAAHPRGYDLPAREFRAAAATLARRHAGWAPGPVDGGLTGLVPRSSLDCAS